MKAKNGAAAAHDEVVRTINAALEGPVVDVLAALVPEIARLPREQAFEHILDDLDLLERSLIAFRSNIPRFRSLLVDARRRPVDDAEVPLYCGRSLDEVVAMVVRTAAKRHFRRRLDGGQGRRPPRRPRKRPDLFARLRALLAGRNLPPARPKTRADLLYDAFGNALAHDWQVPLVPEYANLTPSIVRRLGPRLLDYRVPEDLRRARMDPDNPPPPTSIEVMEALGIGVFQVVPDLGTVEPLMDARPRVAETRPRGMMAPAPTSEQPAVPADNRAPIDALLTADGRRLRAGAFDAAMLDPDVRLALPEAALTLKVSDVLGRVGATNARMMVEALGFSTEQLAVALMSAHATLGDKGFEAGFGDPGRPDYIGRVVGRAKAAGLGGHSRLDEVGRFVTDLFSKGAARR